MDKGRVSRRFQRVRESTWLEVQYPAKFSALNDQEGNQSSH